MDRKTLYNLPKDMLIKIIESGFSIDNLTMEECSDLRNKCKKRVIKLRMERIKNYIRTIIEKEKEEIKQSLLNILEKIVSIDYDDAENEFIFYSKNFEFLLTTSRRSKGDKVKFKTDYYIALPLNNTASMINEYEDFIASNGQKNPELYQFYNFMIDSVDPIEIQNMFCL